jgi:hypothetical protein
MTLKTGILAAAAALTLAVPAAALAQPGYGSGYGYAPSYGYDRSDYRNDWRRVERERQIRRMMEMRRLRWEREHAFRDGGFYGDYRR